MTRPQDLPELEVDTFRSAIIWAGEHRRRVHLTCQDAETAEECLRLLRDRLGRQAADALVRVSVRGEACS